MPVIIHEIQITAEVGTVSSSGATPSAATGNTVAGTNKDAIVAVCVEEVLRIIHEKAER